MGSGSIRAKIYSKRFCQRINRMFQCIPISTTTYAKLIETRFGLFLRGCGTKLRLRSDARQASATFS